MSKDQQIQNLNLPLLDDQQNIVQENKTLKILQFPDIKNDSKNNEKNLHIYPKENNLKISPKAAKVINMSTSSLYDVPDQSYIENKIIFRLTIAAIFCFILMIAEVIGGAIAHSLAIMTDAAHMLSDLSAFGISIFAVWLSKRPSTQKLSYGFHRAEVLGALVSIILIWGLTIWLIYEAIERCIDQSYEIDSKLMLGTAIFGLICNLAMGKILHSAPGGHGHSHGGHGHSHGGHGHSHGGHGKSHGGHGHSHGEQGHSHGEHVHSHEQHDHSHGEHDHSHGEHDHGHDAHLDIHQENENQNNQQDGNNKNHQQFQVKLQINISNINEQNNNEVYKDEHEHINALTINGNFIKKRIQFQNSDTTSENSYSESQQCQIDNKNINNIQQNNKPVTQDQKQNSKKKQIKNNLSQINPQDNQNYRAAMIHILGDVIQSIGVCIAALIIFFKPEYKLADPICTFIFAVLVIFTTIPVLKDCITILMEGTPVGISLSEFEDQLLELKGVKEIHDLHVWQLSVGKPAMSAHIFSKNSNQTLKEATQICRKYGIYHSTLQVEDWKERKRPSFIRCQHNIH